MRNTSPAIWVSMLALLLISGCQKKQDGVVEIQKTATPSASVATQPTPSGPSLTLAEYEAKEQEFEAKVAPITEELGNVIQKAMPDIADPKLGLPVLAEGFKHAKEQLVPLVNNMKMQNPPQELKEWHEAKSKDADAKFESIDKLVEIAGSGNVDSFKASMASIQEDEGKRDMATAELLKRAGYDPAIYESEHKFVKLSATPTP